MFNLKYRFAKLRDDIFFENFNNVLSREGKARQPYYVIWDCTRRCNLNCSHCGATKEKYSKELSAKQVKRLIDELSELKVPFFAVTGGEPLMRKDLLEILSYASAHGIKTGIASNGFFIDEKMALAIKEACVHSMQISLDGTEKTHNRIRGSNESYKRATNALKLLIKQNIPIVSVATTVTPNNFAEMKDLLNVLLELQVKQWRISIVMPIGRAKSKNLLLRPAQLEELFEFIVSNKNRGIKIIVGENLPFLGRYEMKIRETPITCPVGFTACCIGVDGNVRGCPEQPDTAKNRQGNILKKPFEEIWKNGFKRYRGRELIKSDKKCIICKDREKCFGGCWVMREGNTHCIHDLLGN